MPQYTPTPNDKSYRKVMVKEKKFGKVEDFKDGQVVKFSDDNVLEITDQAGKVRVYYRDNDYNKPQLRCCKTAPSEKTYWVNKKAQYMTRVYVTDESGMEYKIPNVLPLHKGPAGELQESCVFYVEKPAYDMDIKGDQYFDEVYSISMG